MNNLNKMGNHHHIKHNSNKNMNINQDHFKNPWLNSINYVYCVQERDENIYGDTENITTKEKQQQHKYVFPQ